MRANEALQPLRRGWQNMIDKGLVTLPEGRSLDDLINFDYFNFSDAKNVEKYIRPQFHSPDFQVIKQLKGGKLKK